jgi:hypothetical protein
LTEEEKKQKLIELRDKMAAKRAVKAKQEAEEAKANELIRRKGGQVCLANYHIPSIGLHSSSGYRQDPGRSPGEATGEGSCCEEARYAGSQSMLCRDSVCFQRKMMKRKRELL